MPCSEPFFQVTGPNQLWCTDFNGYFTTGDGKCCDPFTITDAYSPFHEVARVHVPKRSPSPASEK